MEILIKNGTIIDGTGTQRKKTDVLIKDELIKQIGEINKKTDKIIDADGLFVTPGFIDVNNDSDHYLTLFTQPTQESLLYQGITTIIGGNCGASLAPLIKGEVINTVSKWSNVSQINVGWNTVTEFFNILKRLGLSLNFGMFCGHTTLRRGILKDDVRQLNPDEKLKMRFLLDKAIEEGCLGMSVGLAYSHTKITPLEELIDLARIVKDHNSVFALHLRNESEKIIESIEEALEIAKETKASLEITHFKITGKENWNYLTKIFQLIDKARQEGLDINFDSYPYSETASTLYIFFPDWATQGGRKRTLENIKDEKIRSKIIIELKPKENELKDLIVAKARQPIFVGKKIEEIAKNQSVGISEALINLYLANEGEIIVFGNPTSEENLIRQFQHPASFLGSNSAGYIIPLEPPKELVHPRCFGAFSKFLRFYVKEKKIINWEEAIKKLTYGPARKFGLENRGILKEGYFADIAVFNPEVITDKATFENPFQYAQGIEYLFINGIEVIEKGKYTGKMAGRIVTRE